jgi:hypothetical protein
MGSAASTLSEQAFNDVLRVLLERFGEEWITNATANQHFSRGTSSLLQDADGIHLIGEPEFEQNSHNFNIWIDFPVDDILAADELAFDVFAHLAEDIFVSTRIFEERGVRYRFVTGTEHDGHLGSLHLTGPHAVEFVNIHKMRVARGLQFNA